MISYIKSLVQNRFLVFVTILALFVGRKVNITAFLLLTRSNNYLDVVVDIRLIVLFVVSILFGGFLMSNHWKKSILVFGYLAIWEIVLIRRGYEHWFHGVERLVYGFLLIVFGWVFWNKVVKEKRLRLMVLCGFIPFLMFDHFLISESTGVFSLWLLLVLIGNLGHIKTLLKSVIFTFLSFHVTVLVIEIIGGSSLGLGLFGESVLDVSTPGLATWQIAGNEILRGYGLFTHPNITGFIGWVCLVVGFIKICHSPWIGRILCAVGITQVVLSGSRMAVLAMTILGVGIFIIGLPKKVAWFGSIIFGGFLTGFMVLRGFSSDIYRFTDLEKWIVLAQSSRVQDLFFGIGLGQYPFYLRDSLPFIERWQYEPVHNIFLLVISEIGVLGVIGLLILALFMGKKKIPLQVYDNMFDIWV
jgi:hypothetical protein